MYENAHFLKRLSLKPYRFMELTSVCLSPDACFYHQQPMTTLLIKTVMYTQHAIKKAPGWHGSLLTNCMTKCSTVLNVQLFHVVL